MTTAIKTIKSIILNKIIKIEIVKIVIMILTMIIKVIITLLINIKMSIIIIIILDLNKTSWKLEKIIIMIIKTTNLISSLIKK
jgi:hypothetical protein